MVKNSNSKGGKPSRGTSADRRLAENRNKPVKPATPKAPKKNPKK